MAIDVPHILAPPKSPGVFSIDVDSRIEALRVTPNYKRVCVLSRSEWRDNAQQRRPMQRMERVAINCTCILICEAQWPALPVELLVVDLLKI
jgi:hypothetical protein